MFEFELTLLWLLFYRLFSFAASTPHFYTLFCRLLTSQSHWTLSFVLLFHVGAQVATLSETFITDRAQVRAFACMPPHMDLQGATPHELLIAVLAGEGSISSVTPHVVSKVSLGCETTVTLFVMALVRLFSVVDSHVSFEITPLGEFLVTVGPVASEWLNSGL